MRYLLICFQNEKYWLEINELSVAMRQVIVDGDSKVHVSCREDCLAEEIIEPNELDGICKEISKDDFQKIWITAIKLYYEEWLEMKAKYSIGKVINGVCKYFYPQGVIIKGKDYMALYKGKKEVSLNELVVARVMGYDEDNLWLILE